MASLPACSCRWRQWSAKRPTKRGAPCGTTSSFPDTMTLAFLASATQLPFTGFLNRILGGPVTALLTALGIHPHDLAAPINNFVAMQILVVLFLTVVFLFV